MSVTTAKAPEPAFSPPNDRAPAAGTAQPSLVANASTVGLSSPTAPDPLPAAAAGPLPLPPLVDSHCHIVFRNFDEDLDAVRDRWREAGVTALVHACVEPAEIPAIRALADRFPELRYAVGKIIRL